MRHLSYLLLITGVLLTACAKEKIDSRDYPRLKTLSPAIVDQEAGITFAAVIRSPGSQPVLDHGFIWGPGDDPVFQNRYRVSLGPLNDDAFQFTYAGSLYREVPEFRDFYVKAFVRTQDYHVIGDPQLFLRPEVPAPVILAVRPIVARWGDTIRITGKYFSILPGENKITLGQVSAPVITAGAESLTFQVPDQVAVSRPVLHLEVNGKKTTIEGALQIGSDPTVTGFSPREGTFGDLITITGTSFHPILAENKVTFGRINAPVQSATSDKLTVRVPDELTVKEAVILVRTYDQEFTLPDPFRLLPPVITSLNPNEISLPLPVTLSGQHFSPIRQNNRVTFGGKPVDVTAASGTQLTVSLPLGPYESRRQVLTVEVAGQAAATAPIRIRDRWLWKGTFPLLQAFSRNMLAVSTADGVLVGPGRSRSDCPCGEFWTYLPGRDQWVKETDFPPGTDLPGASGFLIGRQLFYGARPVPGEGDESKFWRYDLDRRQWQRAASLPPLRFPTNRWLGFSAGGRGFLVDEYWRGQLLEYRPADDRWIVHEDLPADGYRTTGVFVFDNRAYLLLEDTERRIRMYSYDPATARIEQKTAPPAYPYSPVAAQIDNFVYLVLLTDTGSHMARYTPERDVWEVLDEFPGVQRNDPLGWAFDGRFYFGAGDFATGNYPRDLWEYDPDW